MQRGLVPRQWSDLRACLTCSPQRGSAGAHQVKPCVGASRCIREALIVRNLLGAEESSGQLAFLLREAQVRDAGSHSAPAPTPCFFQSAPGARELCEWPATIAGRGAGCASVRCNCPIMVCWATGSSCSRWSGRLVVGRFDGTHACWPACDRYARASACRVCITPRAFPSCTSPSQMPCRRAGSTPLSPAFRVQVLGGHRRHARQRLAWRSAPSRRLASRFPP